MSPNPETFRVVFTMYRQFYEDVELRDNVVKNTWLSTLQSFGGTPADNSNIHVKQSRKYLGIIPAEEDEYWDSVRLSVVGRAYRTPPEELVILSSARDGAIDDFLRYTFHTLQNIYQEYDEIDGELYGPHITEENVYDEHVPQYLNDLGTDPDAHKYPWGSDAATWYPEYADED